MSELPSGIPLKALPSRSAWPVEPWHLALDPNRVGSLICLSIRLQYYSYISSTCGENARLLITGTRLGMKWSHNLRFIRGTTHASSSG